jgi:hypothetical protein
MICGFAVKAGGNGSYIEYTTPELWLKPDKIDSPISCFTREAENRTVHQLIENKKTIDNLLDKFINNL